MKDLMMINPSGVTRLFRFVTPAALSLLAAAGWEPTLRAPAESVAAEVSQVSGHSFLD